ncbi:hypothetical protein FOZ62_016088, partial [Perkinsus olseni]
LYGRGSCKYLISGCYFCPPTDPCDLDTLLAQKVDEQLYGGGDVNKFELFSMIWEAIEVEFGPDHVAQANEAYSTEDPMLAAYVDATGLICFRRSFTERLP